MRPVEGSPGVGIDCLDERADAEDSDGDDGALEIYTYPIVSLGAKRSRRWRMRRLLQA